MLEESVNALSYTAESLTQGETYRFKVQAKNLYGYSEFSNIVRILAAQSPAKPVAPETVWQPETVTITWIAPDDGGSPITGFTVSVREIDGESFSVETANCDVSPNLTCTIPVSTLRAEPYSLEWGSSVYAKVLATNAYGDSLESKAGNGAVILTAPSPPTDLVRS